MRAIRKEWINILFLVATIIINVLSVFGLINGLSQKEISSMYPTLITPSPITFTIWSIIYVLLIISFVIMLIKKDDPYYEKVTDEITTLFIASCILNITWIFSFSYLQLELSVLIILALAITLTLICQKLILLNDGNHCILNLSFGVYAGWLLIASVVNIAVCLVKSKWDGFGIADEVWAIIILIAAITLVILVLSKIQNAIYPFPVAWAYLGINQFLSSPNGFNGQYVLLQNIAFIGAIVILLIAIFQFYKNCMSLTPRL